MMIFALPFKARCISDDQVCFFLVVMNSQNEPLGLERMLKISQGQAFAQMVATAYIDEITITQKFSFTKQLQPI